MDLKKVNSLTNKELFFNIDYVKKIFDKEKIDKNALYLDIITGQAAQSENMIDASNKAISSIISNPLTNLVNRIKTYKNNKIAQKEADIENFLTNLSSGEATLNDYVSYLKTKYKLSVFNKFSNLNNINKLYELEVKLVNGDITLNEFSHLNKLKGITGVEHKVLLNDFMHKSDMNKIIRSSTLYTYKDLLQQKINNGKVLNDYDFKNILKIEGLSEKQVEQVQKIAKGQQIEMKQNHIEDTQQEKLKSKFQRNALEVIKEEKHKNKL